MAEFDYPAQEKKYSKAVGEEQEVLFCRSDNYRERGSTLWNKDSLYEVSGWNDLGFLLSWMETQSLTDLKFNMVEDHNRKIKERNIAMAKTVATATPQSVTVVTEETAIPVVVAPAVTTPVELPVQDPTVSTYLVEIQGAELNDVMNRVSGKAKWVGTYTVPRWDALRKSGTRVVVLYQAVEKLL